MDILNTLLRLILAAIFLIALFAIGGFILSVGVSILLALLVYGWLRGGFKNGERPVRTWTNVRGRQRRTENDESVVIEADYEEIKPHEKDENTPDNMR